MFILPVQHRRIAKKINKSKPEIFIAYHSWMTKSPILMRYIMAKKIIYICHEPLREYYDLLHISTQSIFDKLINLLRLPIKHVDAKNISETENLIVVANSKFSKANIDKAYSVNSVVIYPGIDLNKYALAYRGRKFTRKDQCVAISVGVLNKLKNQEYLISSIAKIDILIRPSLILAGNGGDKRYIRYLQKLATYHDVDLSIKLNLNKTQLIKELQSADIFLFSPIAEPFGLVVLEAMAAGLPIIATDTGGGYTEILTPNNAILSSAIDENIFANDIVTLQKNSNRRKKMSQKNQVDVKKYSSNIMNENLWHIIQHST